MTAKEYMRVLGERGTLYVQVRMVVTQDYTYAKTHQSVHFKWVHFIICKSHFRKVDL